MKTKTFQVSVCIEVDANSPLDACRQAWDLLAGPGAMLPVCNVTDGAQTWEIDLDNGCDLATGQKAIYKKI